MAFSNESQEQFLTAYDQHADAIFRHCYFRVYDRELANDLMQDTFTKTWQYILHGSEVKNIRAFLYRVANNLIIDHSRKKKTISLTVLQEKGFDPRHDDRESLASNIDAKAVVALLEKLDKKYQDVIGD
ncbi:MAG: RNA polymerase sigma factor [Candidatus Wildermuthbacteria bacterium]|nr:RNA polymerase sigma factor [Candidatus Wildermuthbacteria bacterium]